MRLWVAAALLAVLWSGHSLAQSDDSDTDTEISKDVENPVTHRITVPFRYEADFNDGAYKATKDIFSLNQAVLPFSLTEDWLLVTRTKMPVEALPPKNLGDHWSSGFSNGYTTFFLSPAYGSGFFWGAGPVLYYPTASNSALGVNKWGTGPSFAVVKKDESPLVLGVVANNIWSLGGPPRSSDRTNQLLINPFASYHFAEGWSLGTSPNITTNWLTSGGKWTVPIGGGPGKAFELGDLPLKLDFDAYYNAIRPKAANDTWLLQVTLTLLFPK
jgi:hypothetical protein